jgi:hypothetical protein
MQLSSRATSYLSLSFARTEKLSAACSCYVTDRFPQPRVSIFALFARFFNETILSSRLALSITEKRGHASDASANRASLARPRATIFAARPSYNARETRSSSRPTWPDNNGRGTWRTWPYATTFPREKFCNRTTRFRTLQKRDGFKIARKKNRRITPLAGSDAGFSNFRRMPEVAAERRLRDSLGPRNATCYTNFSHYVNTRGCVLYR